MESLFSDILAGERKMITFFTVYECYFLRKSSSFDFSQLLLRFEVAETTNLMAIDTQRFMDLIIYIHMLWSSPLQIILCTYFLWGILGPASMAGTGLHVT
jgi:hypothetical protein